MLLRLDSRRADFEARFTALPAAKREIQEDLGRAVAAIPADVRARGEGLDAHALSLAIRLDAISDQGGAR